MADLTGALGAQISGSISKSLAGFAAGMRGAAVSGNPAVFGAAMAGMTKLMKADRDDRKRAQAFEEENRLEQRKLFTDILGEQKKTNEFLKSILEALIPKESGNFLQNILKVLLGSLVALGRNIKELIKALAAFGEFLKGVPFKILGFLEDLLRGLLRPLDFIKDIIGRFGRVLDFIKDLFSRFGNMVARILDFLGDLINKLRVRFPSLDNLFKFFEDLPKRFGDFFKNLFERFKKLPFVDDLIKFFEELPAKFRERFNSVLDFFKNAFDDFKTKFKIPSFDDIVKAFDNFKSKIRLPDFEDIIRAIEKTFDALPARFDRLRNATLINVAIIADLLDEVKANIGAKFDSFKATFSEAFGRVGSLIDDLSIKFDSLRTSAGDFFSRITTAFQDGRLALSLEDLGKIMPEILGTSGGFFEKTAARFGYYFQQIVEAGQRALKFVDEVAGPYLKMAGEIGQKILKFLVPLDIVLSIFDGFMLATSEDKIAEYLNKDELQVTFMDRVAAFLGGSISSFIFGFFDVAVKLVDWIAGNIFGSQTWEESANLGLQTIFDEGLTVFFEQMVAFGKEVFNLLKGLFTLDGDIITNALREMWYIFDDFVVNIVNTMERVLDAIGVRKYLAKAFNVIGNGVVGMLNSVMQFFSNVTTWVAEKLGSLPDFLGGAKFREFATNYKYTPMTFEGVSETYDKKRDSVVSERQRRSRESASELRREVNRAPPPPAKTPATKQTPGAPAPKTGFSTGYTPTDLSNQPLSVRNNNPGNLRFANQAGAVPGEGGFARFETPEAGMAAMRRQIELDTQTRGMTLAQFISKYAPPGDNNDTGAYIRNMSAATGLGPNDRVPTSMIPSLQSAMIRMEGGAAASQRYEGVPSSTGSNWPSMMTVGYNPAVSYGSGTRSISGEFGRNPYYDPRIAEGQGLLRNDFMGPITGPETTYIRDDERLREQVRSDIESRRVNTTAYTGQGDNAKLVNYAATSNEMETQNLMYTQQMAQGIQQMNQYQQQRKNLEMQFLGQVSNDVSRSIYKALGPLGMGQQGPMNSAFGAINQLYQGAFDNFATKLLGKDMGPIYGSIFSQVAASYTDQFINTVLGPMFGPNAAQGFNRAISNYAAGSQLRKQYDVLKSDYDRSQAEFKSLSAKVTLVDRLNALDPLTSKPSQEKLNLIQQVDAMESALAQKGIQLNQAKELKDQNKKMVTEDLIYAITGIPTGMRSFFGYEQGVQNFSQQMALMIGQPLTGIFNAGNQPGQVSGYEEYKRQVERQMKFGIDAQGRAMEFGAQQMQMGMITAGDYHTQGMGQVLGGHLQGMAQISQMQLQGQAQIAQMQQRNAQMNMMMGSMGGGGGGGFFGTLGSIWDGITKVGSAVSDVFTGTKSIGDAISGIFKPTPATGGGGAIAGQTGPSGGTPAGGGFMGGMGNFAVDLGTMYAAQKLGLGFGPATFAMNAIGKNIVAGKGLEGIGDILKGGAGGPGIGGTLFSLYALKNANLKSPGGILNTALAAYQLYNAIQPGSMLATGLGNVGSYAYTASGAAYGTGFLSEQSRMLAAQEWGMGATNAGGNMLANAGLNLVGGMAGTFIGNAIAGDKQLIKGIGSSSIGSVIGGFVGGPVGALIGGVLGGVVDSLFGMGPQRTTSAGISGTLAEGSGTQLKEYENWHQEGGKFRSSRSGRNEKAASQELVDYMQAGVNKVFTGVREGAQILGVDPNAIAGFTQAIDVNLLGKSQADQATALRDALVGFGEAMLGDRYPDLKKYVLENEKLIEAFARLTEATTFMNTAFEMLLYDATDLAKTLGGKVGFELADLKYKIMGIFGGKDLQEQQDNFNKYVGDYYKIFYTQQEQLTFSLNQKKKEIEAIEKTISDQFKIPGIELPKFGETVEDSRKAYRDFVDNFVATTGLATEEQRQTYALLIKSGPLYYQAAQEYVELNKQQKKKLTRDELIAEGAKLIGDTAGMINPLEAGVGVFSGDFANSINSAAGSLDYIATNITAAAPGVIPTNTLGAGSTQFLNEQGVLNNGGITTTGSTNVNTVVDNSVKAVSSPVTTFIMNDDKVRDFHPILRNVERTSLRAFSLAMR